MKTDGRVVAERLAFRPLANPPHTPRSETAAVPSESAPESAAIPRALRP